MFLELCGPYLYSVANIMMYAPNEKGIFYCCGEDPNKPYYIGKTIGENVTIRSSLFELFQNENWIDVTNFYYKISYSTKEIIQEEENELEKYKPKYNQKKEDRRVRKKITAANFGKNQPSFDLRQIPIFDKRESVFAYEFSIDERVFAKDNYQDSVSIKAFAEEFAKLEIDLVTAGKIAAYRFHNNFILSEAILQLPDKLKVKIDEHFPINDASIKICQNLRKNGFPILLADMQKHKELVPLTAFSEIIYFDWNDYSQKPNELNVLLKKIKNLSCKALATRVDKFHDYDYLRRLGVDYFQGDFYLESLPVSWGKLKRVNLMAELWKPENSFDSITNILQQEPLMVERMLLLVNSSAFKVTQRISSLQSMVTTLGKKEVLRMVTIVSLAEMAQSRPNKIFFTAMMRGKFAELIAREIGQKQQADLFFIMATFTLLDIFLDVSVEHVFTSLPISPKIQEMMMASSFNEVIEIVVAYEKGEWAAADLFRAKLRLNKAAASQAYREAANWTKLLEAAFEENGVL